MKYTKERLAEIVAASTTIAQVIRALGLREAGGNFAHIAGRIKHFEIDISHFKKHTEFLRPGHGKQPWQEILVKRASGRRQHSLRLRRALVEYGRSYKCESKNCGISDWCGAKLTLEVDHIDNDWLNDLPDNLRFLCPNCHSQRKHKHNK